MARNNLARWPQVALIVLALSALPLPLNASEGHDHPVDPQLAIRVDSLDDAVNAVAYFHCEVDAHIAAGELAKVHGSAFAARDAATSAAGLAGVLSESARQELALTVQRIGAVAVQLDKYGDAGKAQETEMFARKMREEVETLQRQTGVAIRSEWKPKLQGNSMAGTSGHGASKCPHKANHGGRFSMALNDAYHVEGAFPATGEFRMYFYDKDSCPILSKGFSGRLILPDAERQAELAPAADGTHLIGRVPSDAALPVSVTAIIRLPHPQTGAVATEHFSYNFYKLTKATSAATGESAAASSTATVTSAPLQKH